MAWYRDAVGADTGLPRPGDEADRVLRYNEDDVLATLALRGYLTDPATGIPNATELEERIDEI